MTSAPRLLGGRYELEEPAGRGGMAQVYRGSDVRLGRVVAIKVLRADLARDPAFQARFRREAQAAASLNAPSIVSVFDTGEDEDGVPYIVMEFVEGRTLADVLRTEGRLLPQRALEVTADVCSALEVAHAAGIVHRDIKPANVMLTPSGEVKVMDFGIARAASDSSATMTQTAAVIGTAAYLSPEQARGEHVDSRSDVYATGCLLYALVTGRPPFVGDSAVAVAYQHVREDPEPPSAFDRSLSPAIDAVVFKAMAKNPANRYQSAQEMRDDLLRALAGEGVVATPLLGPAPTVAPAAVTSLHQPPSHRRRKTLVYTVFAVLLVGTVAGVALLVRALLAPAADLVPAPALVGRQQQEALLVLAEAGLQVGQVTEQFSEEPVGEVLTQTPPQGIVVQRGGSVDIVVSRGVEMTVVPEEVIGLSREDAEALLQQAKLGVERVVTRDGNLPAGQVLEISPAAGTQVRAGSSVILTVASGEVDVPSAVGLSQAEATDLLQQAGFQVGIELRDDPGEPGRVLSQSPVNTTADRGSVVTLVVSRTPAPSPTPTPSPTPSPTPTAAEPSPTPTGEPPPPTG